MKSRAEKLKIFDKYSQQDRCGGKGKVLDDSMFNTVIEDLEKLESKEELEQLNIPYVVRQSEQYCVCEVKDPEIKAMWIVCSNCSKPIKDE
jgi:hypothetical protein